MRLEFCQSGPRCVRISVSLHHISTELNQNREELSSTFARSAVLTQGMVDWICTFQVRGMGIALCIQKQWSEACRMARAGAMEPF